MLGLSMSLKTSSCMHILWHITGNNLESEQLCHESVVSDTQETKVQARIVFVARTLHMTFTDESLQKM